MGLGPNNSPDEISFLDLEDLKEGQKFILEFPSSKSLLSQNLKNYTNGKLNGKRTVYYPSGSLSLEENYKDGELDGKSTSYHIAGGINCDGTFTNGKINGTLTCYYPTGNEERAAFKEGRDSTLPRPISLRNLFNGSSLILAASVE